MQKRTWQKWVKNSADPKRAGHFLDLLAATSARSQLKKFSADQSASSSPCSAVRGRLANCSSPIPTGFRCLTPSGFNFPRRAQGFQQEVEGWLKPGLDARDYTGALTELRRFKQRELLRIAARDLARLGNVVEITRELSDVADVCLEAVWRICRQQFTDAVWPAVSPGRRRPLAADGILPCSASASSADRNSITVRTWT